MPISKSGNHQFGLCDLGTLATTPADPIAMGIRGAYAMKTSAYKPIKDYLQRTWRNMINFRVEAESYQPTMFMLSKMIEWLNGNVDAQIITKKQTSGASNGDVYKFTGTRKAGLDFELMFNSDKRSLKPILEVALPYTDAQTFIDLADSDTPIALPTITGPGEDQLLFRRPSFVKFEAPDASTILTKDEIVSRSYSIKTKSKKQDETNMSIVDYLTFELTMKFRNASVAKHIEIMSKDNAPSVTIRELNNAAFYDEWKFSAGVLTLDHELDDADEDRSLTLKFMADVFLFDIAFLFGATYGGDVSDGGTKGGTMTIGA
jgi:hypothetical protein